MTSIKKDFSVTKGIRVQTSIKIGDAPAKNSLLDSATVTQFVQKPEIASSITAVAGLISKVYDSADLLPLSGNAAGDFGFVNSTNRLYLWNGSGWYNIALINSTPTLSTTPDSNYSMDSVGASLSITILAADPEEVPIEYSYLSDSASNFVTITLDSNVFTISPLTQAQLDSNGVGSGGTFSITFRASDGINIAPAVSNFTLTLAVTYDWSTTSQSNKITASDAANNDFFGNVVDIDGDYAVVGARGNKAVYVYYYNGSTWSEQQKIQQTAFGSNFGHAVSIVGDTLLVGSNNTDGSNADGTKAYVYTRSGTTWSLQQKVDPSQALENDFFGYQKTMKLDKSNNNQFIAGAYTEDETNSDEGAVYIFNRSGSSWTETQRIVPSDKATNSKFGVSAAIAGDYAIFGGNGSCYVYYKSGGTWSQQQKIANPYAAGNGHSGPTNAVNFAADGEISINDAGDTIAVGARGQFNLPGYVFIFTRSNTTWSLEQALRASDYANDDFFGWSCQLDSTGNILVVGAKGLGTGGKAYVFTRSGSTWSQQANVQASDTASNWEFGEGIGISGEDGRVIVGARQYNSSASGQGAAYIFNASAS